LRRWALENRVESLSEKMKPALSEGIRIDFDSFPEPEKQLLRRVFEIEEKYGSSPPSDIMEANGEFVFKALEVLSWRVAELFMDVVPKALGCDEIEEWFFKLYFCNFLKDLKECLKNVRKWSVQDREEFLRDMKENKLMSRVRRIPRGFNDQNRVEDENKQGVTNDE